MLQAYLQWLPLAVAIALSAMAEEVTPASTAEAVYKMECTLAQEAFDKATKIARAKYVVFLKAEQVRLIQKGDLDGAVAVRNKIRGFEEGIVPEAPAQASIPAPTASPVWDAIKARVFLIQANQPFTVGLLGPGEWEIVPHPNDKWATAKDWDLVTGGTGMGNYKVNGNPTMLLMVEFTPTGGRMSKDRFDVPIVGPGKLVLVANDNIMSDNVGSVRVKLLRKGP